MSIAEWDEGTLERFIQDRVLGDPRLSAVLARPSVAGGTGQVTFSASALSNTVTVAHGLGRVPRAVVVSALGYVDLVFAATNLGDATSFDVTAARAAGAWSGSPYFAWVAL